MTYPAPDKPPKDDWFDNPLDSMPIATDKGGFDWEDTAPSEYEPPDEEPEEVTMHEKMYRMATARYNPFSIGGSENCHSDIDCPTGGSEAAWKVPPRPEEEIYDQLNDPYGGY
tara:strand:- start:67 stop:405 length:339 start_codon:yes stop_codon:yes gene_type:complete